MGLGGVYEEIKSEKGELDVEARRQELRGTGMAWRIHPLLMTFLTKTKEINLDSEMWFGPSVIAGMCSRAYVLAHIMGVPLLRDFSPNNYWSMDHGTVLHEMMQSMWLGPMGVLKGGWKCSECAHVYGLDPNDRNEIFGHDGKPIVEKVTVNSSITRPETCEACGMEPGWRRNFIYVEPIAYDLELKVAGWTDGLISVPYDEDELIDIKSCKASALRGIKKRGPYVEHVRQLMWYLEMTGIRRGRLVYIARGEEDFAKAIVEVRVDLDEEVMAKEREKVCDIRQALREEKPKLPPCPNGGRRPWGPCECGALEDARAQFGY